MKRDVVIAVAFVLVLALLGVGLDVIFWGLLHTVVPVFVPMQLPTI